MSREFFRRSPWYARSNVDDDLGRAETSPSSTAHVPDNAMQPRAQPSRSIAQRGDVARQSPHEREPRRVASPFLTTKEAARYLRLSHRTLERLRVTGSGPRYRRAASGGKKAKVLYLISDLDDWVSKSFSSTSEHE